MAECRRVGRVYTIDGVRVPSVTEILGITGFMAGLDRIDPVRLAQAAERGTAVHQLCEEYDKQTIDWAGVPPEHLGYLDAYMEFVERFGFESELVEEPLYNETLMFAGTVDRVGRLTKVDGRRTVLDIKTGAPRASVALQLAGYELCLPAVDDTRRVALYLNQHGEFKLAEYADRRDHAVFRGAAVVAHWKLHHKLAAFKDAA